MSTTLALQVGNLAPERIEQLDRGVSAGTPGWRAWLASRIHPAGWMAKWTRLQMERAAKLFEQEAVWFEGAAARLRSEKAPRPNVLAPEVADRLEAIEQRLLAHRETCLRLLGKLRTQQTPSSKAVAEALSAQIEALSDCYEAISAFRWEAMEVEADYDIASGQVSEFTSPQALAHSLKP